MQELEDGEECSEMMLSSGHGMTTALMNSQELWLPAQNQTSQHCSIDWGGAHEAATLAKECGEVKPLFFRAGLVLSCQGSSGWLHTHAHANSTNWTQRLFQKEGGKKEEKKEDKEERTG